jgi:hypothetical protein
VDRDQRASFVHPQKRRLVGIVLLGGAAVLASYARSLGFDPASQAALWGGVPPAFLPAYVTSMALATMGFFAFTFFLLFRADPGRVRIALWFGYGLFSWLYMMILAPSALWLPLTSAMVQQPDGSLWLAVRLVLLMVAVGSVLLLLALLSLRPRTPVRAYWIAVAGGVAFCLQTAVLDLFVWTAFFPA